MPRRRNRQRGRRRGGKLKFNEAFTFSITNGGTSTVSVATIANRPPRSNFRPIVARVTAVGAWVPPATSLPGYWAPGAIQLQWYSPAGYFCATSSVVVLGTTPRTVTLRYPRNEDYYPYNQSDTEGILSINATCIGTATGAVIRGAAELFFEVEMEYVVPTCPTLLTQDPEEDEDGYITCA